MADDLEAFLRRAAARRAAQKKQAVSRPAPRPAPPRPPVSQVPPVQASPPVIMSAPVEAETTKRFDQRSRAIEAEVKQLGNDVIHEETELDAHMHDVFDHRVGQLDADAGFAGNIKAPPAARSELTTDIMQVLKSPELIRNAVVLAEILSRPEHRWED